jgi:HPt (histidine-containing phosphotransfer) domain-containing protein
MLQILNPPTTIPPVVYEKLIYLFLTEVLDDFSFLKTASKNNNWPEVKRLAHKIGGVSNSYGAMEIYDLSKIIELSVKQPQGITYDVTRLEEAIHKLEEHIRLNYVQPKE